MSERAGSSSFGGMKDFSVETQRKMFMEAQEKARQAAENKRNTRKIRSATAGASGIALSGMMANMENPRPGGRTVVGDDDDDSLGGDDYSVDSEESFYVGIERADYAQPDSLEMYGTGSDGDLEIREDLLGISRASVAIINRTGGDGKVTDWDGELVIHDEKTSSLYDFMHGTTSRDGKRQSAVVGRPIVGSGLDWTEESKLGDGDADAGDQVYEHGAAEGKAFIDKLVGDSSSSAAVGGPATPGKSEADAGREGSLPVLSPMALFSPGITGPVKSGGDGESNAVRQMREREIRKDAAAEKMAEIKKLVMSKKDNSGMVDAEALMKQMEALMAA
mmetsp:Transcript_24920/g.56859  ORF Transcript_24920/g.56859 Transcript_24920/m.56859 type:complete len:334 (+) Transcript_24920:154-1155(+)